MALDDAINGSGPDFTADSVLDRVSRGVLPDLQDNASPDMVLNRLNRKLSAPKPPEAAPAAEAADEEAKKPDFSSQGTPIGALPDLSSEGTPIEDVPPPAAPPAPLGMTGQAGAFVKGIGQGAATGAGNILQGAAIKDNVPESPQAIALVDQLAAAPSMTPSQRAKLMGDAIRTFKDRGNQMDFNAALRRISSGADPATEIAGIKAKLGAFQAQPTTPVEERPLYQGGAQLKKSADAAIGMTDQEKASLGGQAGQVVGGVAPYALIGAISPAIGLGVGVAGMAATSAGATFEEAKAKGANDADAAKAAGLSALVGGGLGIVPLGAILRPVSQASPGITAWAAAKLNQALVSGVTFATIGEAQEYLQQQIAKHFYDPKAGYSWETTRVLASLLGGAAAGAVHPLHKPVEAAPEAPLGLPGRSGPAAGAPPPGGAGPEAGAPGGGPGGGAPPEPASAEAKAGVGRANLEKILRYYGFSDVDIAAMSHAEMSAKVREKMAAGAGAKPSESASTAQAQPEAKPEQTSSTEQAQWDTLRRYGWTEAEISQMSPAQRRREFQNTMETGTSEPPKAAKPAEEPAASIDLKGKTDDQLRSMMQMAEQQAGRFEATINDPIEQKRQPKETLDHYKQQATSLRDHIAAVKHELASRATSKSDAGATSFTTAKGSTYEVHDDGTTTRNKAARAEHPGDEGPKERSAKTVYFDSQAIRAFDIPDNTRWRVIDHGDGTMSLATWNEAKKDWGISPGSRNVAYSEKPAVGLHPLEVWKPGKIKGLTAYKGVHPGNAITEIGGPVNATPGTREAPIKATSAADVIDAQPAEPKSQAQAEAENYKHSHVELPQFGLTGKHSISIETGIGQERKGVGDDGKPWSVTMKHGAYGRIKGTVGADGDHLDVFVGPHPTSQHVFVIDQHDPATGAFDEHKIMAGYRTPIDALHAYANAYTDGGKDRIGHVKAMGPDEFKAWLKGDTTKPLKPEGATPEEAAPQSSTEIPPTGTPKATPAPGAEAGAAKSTIPQAEKVPVLNGSQSKSSEPLSLLQFLASKGGLKPHGDLQAMDAQRHRVQIPGRKGFFGLVKTDGLPLDMAREAAEEAGYLRGKDHATSTERDLLDAIDKEIRGTKLHAEGEEGSKTKREIASEDEAHAGARDKEIGHARDDIAAEYADLPEDLLDHAATIMFDENLDIDSAVEQAALRMVHDDADYGIAENDITQTFGKGAIDAIQPKRASENGGAAARAGSQEQGPGEGKEAKPHGERVPAAGEKEPQVEVTAAGKQSVISGAEKIGQGEQAQREANKPLKPKVEQKPADTGLFGDEMNQSDLLDRIDKVLGIDADKVAPVDIARAAELMSENPGMEPETAFGQAVIETAVEQGFITEQEAIDAYGQEAKELLDAGREGASERGAHIEQSGAAPVEVGAGGREKAGELPSGGEGSGAKGATAGEVPGHEATAATEAAEQPATAGKAAEHKPAAETPGNAKVVVKKRHFPTELLEAEQTARETPTWAEILAQLPMSKDGRTRQHETAFDLMTQITGDRRPAFKNLTSAEKVELLKLVRGDTVTPQEASDGVQNPVPEGDAGSGTEDVQPIEPGGQASGVRGAEGPGSGADVRGIDEGRAEGAGRIPEGTGSERSGGGGAGSADRVPGERADDAANRREKRDAQRAANRVEGENYSIAPGSLDEGRPWKTKARDNIRAIELMREINAADRPATHAEQEELARYVGWGGIKNAFPDANGAIAPGFEKIAERVKDLLEPTEYETARRSIQYAHYTSEDIVRAMWDAVGKLGFKEGQVFEPGMGVGNFAGMMPADIAANTHYVGLELDHTTAQIAKLLYPKYGVRRDDFTKAGLPADNYDLVIGNPPFADIAISSDPKYPQKFLLHDYFFAKSLDSVRPGGVLAFITSAGTMNKIDPKAREYLADRADLVGAVRLPGNAFAKNAGTEVTTDIVFLRKRLPGEAAGDRAWTGTETMTLPGAEGAPVKGAVSAYFAQHPEMVLGEQGFFDKLYKDRYAVRAPSGFDFPAELAKALDRLPADVMKPWQDVNAEHTEEDFATTEKKEGTFYVGPNGALHQMQSGVGRPVAARGKGVEGGRTAADIERIRGLVPVRDALRAVYAADLKGDVPAGDKARGALNKHYDAFVEKFGPINKAVIQTRRPNVIQMEAERAAAREEARYADRPFREGTFDAGPMLATKTALSVIARERQAMREDYTNRHLAFDEGEFDETEVPDNIIDKRPNVDPFMDDPESYRLRAIERYDEASNKAFKSPVFTENVIAREKVPEINSVNDALLYSLSQYGRVNVPEMARLAKLSDSEVVEKLGEQVFKAPGTKDVYQARGEYLSGDVRKKLDLAKAAAEKNPDFRRNVTALEAAQPMPLAPSQIHATLGMPWIPEATVQDFATKELGLDNLKAKYIPGLAQWIVSGDTGSVASTATWGTTKRNATALIGDALNHKNPKVYDEIYVEGRKQSVLNIPATEAAQDKVKEIQERFADWIWKDQDRADQLAGFYNEKFNNLVVREYDGSYLTTPGIASSWKWRPHQTRGIARIIQSGNTYLAHAVGAGKTSEYIGAVMEMRRLGLVRKPMIAVPNHMLAQFTKEFYEQYPTARLAVADERRFHTDKRKQFIANVANDDLDAVIITHSAFGMIPVSDAFHDNIIGDELQQYRELLAKVGGDRITRSRVEKQIERLEQRLQGKGKKRRDAVFTFEEMGIDHLSVDEAHLFRKLDFTTQMSNLKGISPEGSGMAWDLYVKAKYLESIRPGRGLVLGSGTPVTNTMAELYTVSRYLQPQVLAERGLEKFDAWAGAFGESVSELEQDAAGNYKPVSRFAKFVNVAELSNMVRQVMDVVTSRQLEQYVTRPQIKTGKRIMNLADKSRELERFQRGLAERMKAIQDRKGPPQKGDDIMLSVINDGRHAAIDMRLAGGSASNIPSKLDMLIDNAHAIYERTSKQKFYKPSKDGGYESKVAKVGPGAQMIFANLGLSGKRGFSVPDYIRAELVRRGVPKDQIAYIYDYKTSTAKQRLFNDVNEGKIRFLIGSTAKMATGVNAQRQLVATHNLDPLWYPSDDEQRNGRIIRQGNMNPEVEIHDYSTKGTYDSTMWGMMAKKAKFIQGFFEGDPSLRDMDDLGEASQYEQAKALTTNDPRLIKLTELRQDLERATRRKTAFDSEAYATRQRRAQALSSAEHYETRVSETKKDIAQREDIRGEAFTAKVGKETFDKRQEFGDALFQRIGDVNEKGTLNGGVKIADIGGFPLYVETRKGSNKNENVADIYLALNGGKTRDIHYGVSPIGTVRSIEAILGGLEHDLADYQASQAKAEKFYAESKDKATAKFTGDAEIADLTKKVRDMEDELKRPMEEAAAPAEEPEEDENALASGIPRSDLSQTAEEHIPQIEAMLRQIVEKLVGPSFKVKFERGLINIEPPRGYGNAEGITKAAGMYYPLKALIRLALHGTAEDVTKTAFHESYHAIEDRLQNEAERELMKRETPRMRALVKKNNTRGFTQEEIDQFAGYEIRAMAFEHYAYERSKGGQKQAGEGIHIGIRKWFERLWQALQQIRNYLRGLGFKSYEDIFNDAFEGKFAGRKASEGNNIDREEGLAAIFRRRQNQAVTQRIKDVMFSTASNRFIERYQNLSEPVKRLQDAVQARANGTLPDTQQFYLKKRLFPGKVGAEVQDFNKEHLDPLIDFAKEKGLTLEQVGDIAYALHAPERNAAMEEINHPALDGSDAAFVGKRSGMSDAEAAAILAQHPADVVAEIDHRIGMIRDFNLRTMVSAGLESQDTADAWRAKYQHYAPLSGWDVEPDNAPDTTKGMGNFNVRGPETKRAFGRRTKAANPMVNILDQSYRTIERAKRNEYVRAAALAIGNLDPAEQAGFVRFDRGKPKKEIDPRTGLVRTVDDSSFRHDPAAVAYKIGGRQHYMIFENRELGEAVARMHPDGLGMFEPLLNIQNKIKALWTHYSPEFLARHFLFRYPIEGTLNSFEQGAKNVPQYVKDAIPFLGHASRAIFAHNKGTIATNPDVAQMQQYYREMREHGGAMTFRSMRDQDLLTEHLKAKLNSLNASKWATVKAKHQAMVEAMDVVTNALDNSLRLAAYAGARRQGKSPEQAALLAREATVDFQLAGKWKKAIGLIFPFGNVAIQTGVRMTAAVARSRIMQGVFGGTMLMGFLTGMFNYLIGGDDKDGIPFMDKIPEWERRLNFTVLNPWHRDSKDRPVPIHIPMPYNWAFPLTIGHAMATMVFGHGKHKVKDMLAMTAKSGMEVLTPFGQEENLAAVAAPEMARPFIHAYTNKNYNGIPVHADPTFQKGPDSQSGRKTTGDGWKYIASAMNTASGGSKHHSGYLDFYPEDYRLMFDYVLGSQRRFAENVSNSVTNAVGGKPTDYSHLPLSRVIMGTDYDAADRARRFERQREEKRPWQQ